ncbi:MAG: DUF6077 domain-containing protein [Myxococcota bacterium]|nr:DUF6077 domain-containing protein [Myxococcota bacterium]
MIDSIAIAGACLFAAWTLYCNILVLLGWSFADLVRLSPVALAAGICLAVPCLRDLGRVTANGFPHQSEETEHPAGQHRTWVWLLTLVAVVAILRVAHAPFGLQWLALVAASAIVFRSRGVATPPRRSTASPRSAWQTCGAGALIVVGALLAATAHRPDLDDSQLLNFVVTALDYPLEPLLSRSGLWLDPAAPLTLQVYRFHGYELLVAALSHLSGLEHKVLYYLVLPPALGAAAVLVHWRLARHLQPHRAVLVLASWLVLIIALGESHRALGNFAFVRMFQGKGALVTVALPLCLLLALRFGEVPDWRRAVALCAAVIASLGFSASALATAPIVVAVVLMGALRGASRTSAVRIVAGGVVAVAYFLFLGAILLATMDTGSPGTYLESGGGAGGGIDRVLGEGVLGAVVLALFPIAPLFVADPWRQRTYSAATLIFTVAVLNPWSAYEVAKLLYSTLQWRFFWSVPLLVSASLALVGLAGLVADRVPRLTSASVLGVLLAALVAVSSRWSVSPDNSVTISLPRFKVEPSGHALAAEIVRRAPPRSTVYAPIAIAAWTTTFRGHPYPLVPRWEYLNNRVLRKHLGNPEADRRQRVVRFIEGHEEDTAESAFFGEQLSRDRPTLVVHSNGVATAASLRGELRDAGYVEEERGRYWLWRRPGSETSE